MKSVFFARLFFVVFSLFALNARAVEIQIEEGIRLEIGPPGFMDQHTIQALKKEIKVYLRPVKRDKVSGKSRPDLILQLVPVPFTDTVRYTPKRQCVFTGTFALLPDGTLNQISAARLTELFAAHLLCDSPLSEGVYSPRIPEWWVAGYLYEAQRERFMRQTPMAYAAYDEVLMFHRAHPDAAFPIPEALVAFPFSPDEPVLYPLYAAFCNLLYHYHRDAANKDAFRSEVNAILNACTPENRNDFHHYLYLPLKNLPTEETCDVYGQTAVVAVPFDRFIRKACFSRYFYLNESTILNEYHNLCTVTFADKTQTDTQRTVSIGLNDLGEADGNTILKNAVKSYFIRKITALSEDAPTEQRAELDLLQTRLQQLSPANAFRFLHDLNAIEARLRQATEKLDSRKARTLFARYEALRKEKLQLAMPVMRTLHLRDLASAHITNDERNKLKSYFIHHLIALTAHAPIPLRPKLYAVRLLVQNVNTLDAKTFANELDSAEKELNACVGHLMRQRHYLDRFDRPKTELSHPEKRDLLLRYSAEHQKGSGLIRTLLYNAERLWLPPPPKM